LPNLQCCEKDIELHLAHIQEVVLEFLTKDKVTELFGQQYIHDGVDEAVTLFD